MVGYYSGPTSEDDNYAIQADLDPYFRLHRPSGAPPPLEREPTTAYRRRLIETLQQHAPNFKDINVRHSTGSAFDYLEKEIKADVQREAARPTMIPEGTLKQVTSYDAAGRPSYSYFGKVSAWLDQFSSPKKRLIGIKTSTDRGYNPGNLG
jgi:hypothetical protein